MNKPKARRVRLQSQGYRNHSGGRYQASIWWSAYCNRLNRQREFELMMHRHNAQGLS